MVIPHNTIASCQRQQVKDAKARRTRLAVLAGATYRGQGNDQCADDKTLREAQQLEFEPPFMSYMSRPTHDFELYEQLYS